MQHRIIPYCCLWIAMTIAFGSNLVRGQSVTSLADDIIVISQGQRAKEAQRDATALGPVHGSAELPFGPLPGADLPRLGAFDSPVRELDILSAASRRTPVYADRRQGILPPAITTPAPPAPALFGQLDASAIEAEIGPPNGMTLDEAIRQLITANPDLAYKFQEIPKADADILTASLWGNPLFFFTAGGIPYGSYTPTRTGSNSYGLTLIQPFDVNGKIRARTVLARQAKRVLEAQFQDAVRLEIENLHGAFVDVLANELSVEFNQRSLATSAELSRAIEARVLKGAVVRSDLDTVEIERELIANSLAEVEAQLRTAKRRLAVLLGYPPEQADALVLRGTIVDAAPTPPPAPELVKLALGHRPDLVAFRLAVRSAAANVNVQKRERLPDVFALYSPYEFNANNDVYQHQGVTSWSAAVFGSIPLVNRNQGNIRRAERNVRQTQIEFSALQRKIVAEVETAAIDYGSTRQVVERFRERIEPRARSLRTDRQRLYTAGEQGVDVFLNAQRNYNDVLRQYRDALVRHRLAMLRLNTMVGLRLLP